MRLLILGINYAPEPVGIGPYTEGMATALARAGHDVSVVTAKPYYPAWKISPAFRGGFQTGRENRVEVTRCPLYVPATPSGLKRILHHASFALTSLLPTLYRALRLKPDVVMTVAPSLIAAPVALFAARVAKAKSWIHIQDLEVEAAIATGLLAANGRAARWARTYEKRVFQHFHQVSSISPQMCAKLIDKGIPSDRVTEIRNWANIDGGTTSSASSIYRREWGISTPHIALYSGNIANKQGIEIIVDAARALKHRKDLTFIVCGEGPNRERLIASAKDLPNIRFHPLQPHERLKDLLSLATFHLLPQISGAADLVLPSKLTNMLASGQPVLACADLGTGLANEVKDCGLVVPPGDDAALAAAITRLINDPQLCQSFGHNGQLRAKQRWYKPAIIQQVETMLSRLKGPDRGGRISR